MARWPEKLGLSKVGPMHAIRQTFLEIISKTLLSPVVFLHNSTEKLERAPSARACARAFSLGERALGARSKVQVGQNGLK